MQCLRDLNIIAESGREGELFLWVFRPVSFGLEFNGGFVTITHMNGRIRPAASTLVNVDLLQIAEAVDGNYPGADYFLLP